MTNFPSYPGPNGDTGVGPDRGSSPGTPRWVKVFVIIAVILVLLFVILQFVSGGEHGPRRHLPSDIDFGNRTLYSILIEDSTTSSEDLGSQTLHYSFSGHDLQQR